MNDKELFESKLRTFTTHGVTKKKYLLKLEYQEQALKLALKHAKQLAKHKEIAQVFVIGSILDKQLGKYAPDSRGRSDYSDIDLFVVASKKLKEFSLKDVGLVKKKYTENNKTYYRVSVANENGDVLRVLDRFSIDLWLVTPYTFKEVMRRVPTILDRKITVK